MPTQPAEERVTHSAPLVEFLNTLPSPLTTTLVALAPTTARCRRCLQILSWKSSWEESWLLLATWWGVCLIPELGIRYILPFAVLVLLFFHLRGSTKITAVAPPITEEVIQRAIADITTIHALLPSTPAVTSLPPLIVIIRVFAKLYPAYLVITYLIPLRLTLALCGTVLLTWRARWAVLIRRSLWRSAHIRWGVFRAWSVLSGQPLPPTTLSPQSQNEAKLASISAKSPNADIASIDGSVLPSTSVRFLFTIYENQRWWMGLDWTAALLPGERPSWCSASQQPAAPPSAFTLPAATTVFTQAPDGKLRVKRTARWRWEEHEWRVVVRKEGTGTSRVERPLPSPKEESAAAASASRILKAAGKMRSPSVDADAGRKEEEEGSEHGFGVGADGHGKRPSSVDEDDEVEEPLTDTDGWVYADNKWEGASAKGGMGKYTRFRRWTRIAVLTETVEIVEAGELGIQRDEPVPTYVHQSNTQPPEVAAPNTELAIPAHTSAPVPAETQPSATQAPVKNADPPTPRGSLDEEGGSRLRQRLKAAVLGATGHS